MDGEGEVLVRFVTQFASIRVPAAAISVPGDLNRSGLSRVIGHLLGVGASRVRRRPAAAYSVSPCAIHSL